MAGEMGDDHGSGTTRVNHREVGLRIDHAQHPRVGFVEKLLPVVGVSTLARAHMIAIFDRRRGGRRRHAAHTQLNALRHQARGERQGM